MIRKTALCAIALCAAAMSASAQTAGEYVPNRGGQQPLSAQTTVKYVPDYSWEIRAGWGYAPVAGALIYALTAIGHITPDETEVKNDKGIATGDLSIDIARKLNRWFAAGADLSWSRLSGTGDDGLKHIMDMYAIMPNVTMNYLTRENVTLYGKLEAGIGVINFECSDPSLFFAAQASPIGVTFGHSVYGFAELSVGTLYQGGKIGFGFRF